MGGIDHTFIFSGHMEYLGPKPFRRIDPTFVLGVILSAPASGQLVDLVGLLYRGMVFPKYHHRIGIFLKARHHGQCRSILGDGHGGRACSIDTNSFHGLWGHPTLFHYGSDGVFQSFDMIQRMLPELVDFRSAILLSLPSGVPEYFR